MEDSNNSVAYDYEYFLKKRNDRVYLSRAIETTQFKMIESQIQQTKENIRIVSKVFDGEEHHFLKAGKEIVLRVTENARQEVKARFYEDSREIQTLQFQKFSSPSGSPHNTSFSFTGDEILKLYNFLSNIAILPIRNNYKHTYEDREINDVLISEQQSAQIKTIDPEVLQEIVNNDINQKDIIGLAYRKDQLQKFYLLLNDPHYFLEEKTRLKKNGDESVWQAFFEANTWILGYGLNFCFNSPLDGKKLEQVTSGYNFSGSGKRVDLLMKSRGLINSLCFGEIKSHNTALLKKVTIPYRPECWAASDELSGGISQIQKTVQKSISNIKTKTEIKSESGDLTGEQLFLYQPKSFLIIGTLKEFQSDDKINEDKFSSFELLRRSINNTEILTFDELYERAKFIVGNQLES